MTNPIDRRALLRGTAAALGGTAALAPWFPARAQPVSAGIVRPLPVVSGAEINLRIAHMMRRIDGRETHGIAVRPGSVATSTG